MLDDPAGAQHHQPITPSSGQANTQVKRTVSASTTVVELIVGMSLTWWSSG